MRAMVWTDERVEILKSRWATNWTARAIAKLLGCTRNAVIGKARRLNLPPHVFHAAGRPVTTRVRAQAAARGVSRTWRVQSARLARAGSQRRHPGSLVDLPATQDEPPSRQISFADLKPGECGWIAGCDGCCCGHATALIFARGRHIASPYCGFHSARAYRAPREKSA